MCRNTTNTCKSAYGQISDIPSSIHLKEKFTIDDIQLKILFDYMGKGKDMYY